MSQWALEERPKFYFAFSKLKQQQSQYGRGLNPSKLTSQQAPGHRLSEYVLI